MAEVPEWYPSVYIDDHGGEHNISEMPNEQVRVVMRRCLTKGTKNAILFARALEAELNRRAVIL